MLLLKAVEVGGAKLVKPLAGHPTGMGGGGARLPRAEQAPNVVQGCLMESMRSKTETISLTLRSSFLFHRDLWTMLA